MRRFMAWFAVLGLLGTAAGCYKGRGTCDCLDYRDPCCYGCYCYGQGGEHAPSRDGHLTPMPTSPPPVIQAEPLKVMPKEPEKVVPPKDKEVLSPVSLPRAKSSFFPGTR